MSHYAVVGNPVEHSKSPQIHAIFAEQTGQDLEYTAKHVEAHEFEKFVRGFFSGDGLGLNITVPYKETAYALADVCSRRATLAKAVNTLYLDVENKIVGDNTDGTGLVTDVKNNHQFEIRNKNILLLGAGGAVRGVLAALVEQDPGAITILNRTVSRAQQLSSEFGALADVNAQGYEGFQGKEFDLIINGTSLSLEGKLPPIDSAIISGNCCCYDMMYGSEDTAFVRWAKNNGAYLALDGIGMLVEQAAESFAIWRGIRPETAAVIALLKTH